MQVVYGQGSAAKPIIRNYVILKGEPFENTRVIQSVVCSLRAKLIRLVACAQMHKPKVGFTYSFSKFWFWWIIEDEIVWALFVKVQLYRLATYCNIKKTDNIPTIRAYCFFFQVTNCECVIVIEHFWGFAGYFTIFIVKRWTIWIYTMEIL